MTIIKKHHSKISLCAVAVASALTMPTAMAADNDTTVANNSKQVKEIEVIQVTSRLRKESIQNVPIAITAFSEQEIEDMGIERAGDFIALTPNMTMVEAQNAGTSFITIRGLSQVRNGESPVAVSVDGVLQISPNQFNQDLFDIAQIEVLKGPQGALYGRNAIGGAINITTKMPTEETSGYLETDIGNGGLKSLTGAVSGQLFDNFLYRVTASHKEFDGLIDNVYLNTEVDFQKDSNVRSRFIWQISDDFTADLRLSKGKSEAGALNYVYQPLFGINDANDASVEIEANNLGYNERDISSIALKLDWQLDLGLLSFITAKDTLEEVYGGDQFPYSRAISANSPFGENAFDGTQTQYLDVDASSYEIRLTSADDQDLRWIAGAYHLTTDRFISSSTGLDLGLGLPVIYRDPTVANDISPTQTFAADDNANNAYAVFAQFNYNFAASQELTVAARYDVDKREQTNRAPLSFDSDSGQVRSEEFKKFQPKVSYSYTGLDNISLYATYSQGFRSGGFNQNGVAALASTIGVQGVTDLYKAEETTNIEAGIKALYPKEATRFNAAVFNTKIDNQHYFLFVGALGAQVLANIDEVNLIGGEFDFKTSLASNFDVYGGVGITDSEIKSFSLAPSDNGNKAPYVPDYTVNLGLQYSTEIIAGWLTMVTLDAERRGQQYWDTENSTARKALNLVNSRIGFNSDDGQWSVNLWAKNIFDKKYNAEWVLGGFAQTATPRSFGIELRWTME
ncbi:iron complex outermembrane recepter protein [Colwellia chukchiensis]|uniref:Iron complex outermembrane recepter protein n=1 Tax=Colwellia chukchiensis TaxID=641665 RepID=A0A1H7PE34_9GAMM|nr:TonB-dependent receptor [Colwellia chukchiensis]SEL33545.1 iron complex outermembrane recepter protein [Colwellia chukchiensis]